MKTLADLKRDAASGRLSLELHFRYGKTGDGIPENMRGVRKVWGVNTVALILRNADGTESELHFDRAKLIAYDGKTLTVFAPGHRDPTEEERAVQNGARRIMEENPEASYWKLKQYYLNSACPWMRPYGDTIRGKQYLAGEDKVLDKSVRGDPILQYVVHIAVEAENDEMGDCKEGVEDAA